MESVFNGEFLWYWVAGRVGGVFCGFDGEACGFPASDGGGTIGWYGFSGREMVGVEAYTSDAREGLRVWRERHCLVVESKKRCVEHVLDSW